MNRGDLSNEGWERLKPLLPTQKPKTGKPNNRPLAKVTQEDLILGRKSS
ncbi:MAG: hypothetical protein RMX98_032895 [Nostoc sp. DedQUE02]